VAIIRYNEDGKEMTDFEIIQDNDRIGYNESHWGTVFIAVLSVLMGILGGIPIWGIALMAIMVMCFVEWASWCIYKRG
jgi:hypothetical protein